MSQRDSISRPPSRASSLSPRTIPPASTTASASLSGIPNVRDDISSKPLREASGVSRRVISSEGPSPTPRALNVHTILNPLDVQARGNVSSIAQQSSASAGIEHVPGPTGRGNVVTPAHPPSQQSYPFYGYTQSSGTPPSTSPQTERSVAAFPSTDRGSPKSAIPLPALNNPRAIFSPSMSRVQTLHNLPGHKPGESIESPLGSTSIGVKRPYEEILGSGASGSLPRPPPPYTTTPTPSIILASAATGIQGAPLRSASQPVLPERRTPNTQHSTLAYQSEGPHSSTAQQQHQGQGAPHWDPRAGNNQPPTFGSGQGQAQDVSTWNVGGPTLLGTGLGRTRARNDRSEPPSQQYLEMNPPGGERYLVEINTQIASKQADEKRQRNAGASARFRQRRKQQALEDKNKIMQLEEDKRNLEARLQETIHQREFYKSERNRLREIVLRTPGISESAHAGPRSPPTSTFTLGGLPDQTQMPRVPPASNIPPSHGYASSETSSIERPTRRRRTDQTPDAGPLSYVQQPQGHGLPPISGAPYGMPPSRPPSASSSGEILPPIRGMESGVPHEPGAPTSSSAPYYSAHRAPYESGWAHRQGVPPEGGQR
ncbi:hypothetical protein jhhlp_001957 [Lomentospora prolificans]|uniref:BZIP domain-containing protein n=1 Tax=Lomentospora prolificans TaxID=41688 RepID=A0A2N3NCS4_9PEZI|nr:hypothetical protein jhhlp_001957 [Lomentospora prolificans]